MSIFHETPFIGSRADVLAGTSKLIAVFLQLCFANPLNMMSDFGQHVEGKEGIPLIYDRNAEHFVSLIMSHSI
jgi:hypothetical protein